MQQLQILKNFFDDNFSNSRITINEADSSSYGNIEISNITTFTTGTTQCSLIEIAAGGSGGYFRRLRVINNRITNTGGNPIATAFLMLQTDLSPDPKLELCTIKNNVGNLRISNETSLSSKNIITDNIFVSSTAQTGLLYLNGSSNIYTNNTHMPSGATSFTLRISSNVTNSIIIANSSSFVNEATSSTNTIILKNSAQELQIEKSTYTRQRCYKQTLC